MVQHGNANPISIFANLYPVSRSQTARQYVIWIASAGPQPEASDSWNCLQAFFLSIFPEKIQMGPIGWPVRRLPRRKQPKSSTLICLQRKLFARFLQHFKSWVVWWFGEQQSSWSPLISYSKVKCFSSTDFSTELSSPTESKWCHSRTATRRTG